MRLPAERQFAPLSIPGFRLLFLSAFASTFGSLLAAVALAIDVKDRTNSGAWVSAVLLVEFLPPVFVGLTLGPLLDRLERRKLMVAADLARAAVFALLPFATSATQIVALAAVAGLATGFFRPALYAGVPNLVPEQLLASANGLLQSVENISWAAGPLIGGVLTAAAGPDASYWINAVSFLVSAVLIIRIPARLLQSETALSRGHWTDLKEGFSTVLHTRSLLAVVIGWGLALAGTGAIGVAEIFMAKNTLDGGDFGYGLLYGAIGVGLVIGSFWSSSVVDRISVAAAYGSSMLAMGIGFAIGAASVDIWMAAACCVVAGVGNGIAVVCNALLVQRTRDEVRGRALTFVMSATWAVSGISIVITGALMSPGDARWVWAVGSIFLGAGALAGFLLGRERASAPARLEPASD